MLLSLHHIEFIKICKPSKKSKNKTKQIKQKAWQEGNFKTEIQEMFKTNKIFRVQAIIWTHPF